MDELAKRPIKLMSEPTLTAGDRAVRKSNHDAQEDEILMPVLLVSTTRGDGKDQSYVARRIHDLRRLQSNFAVSQPTPRGSFIR